MQPCREPPGGARRRAMLLKLASELPGGNVITPGRARRYCVKRVKRWGCGAVGARFLGMEEAAGSIPASSTRNVFSLPKRVVPREIASRPYRDERFFYFDFTQSQPGRGKK